MEKSAEKEPETTAGKNDQNKSTDHGGPKTKSAWETAFETIVGDNKLLSTVLKIVLSPIGLVAVLCGVGYLVYKNMEYKKENAKLSQDYKDLKAAHEQLKEKYLDAKSRKMTEYKTDGLSGKDYSRQGERRSAQNRKTRPTFYFD